MARSRSRSQSGGGGGRSATQARSRKPSAPAVEVEVVEESRGLGVDDGIIIATTLVLLAAVLVVDYVRGSAYDAGMFF